MTRADGLIRFVSNMFRRYCRDPDTRHTSSRHLVCAAIALCAEHNGLGEAALIAAETLAELKQEDRRQTAEIIAQRAPEANGGAA